MLFFGKHRLINSMNREGRHTNEKATPCHCHARKSQVSFSVAEGSAS